MHESYVRRGINSNTSSESLSKLHYWTYDSISNPHEWIQPNTVTSFFEESDTFNFIQATLLPKLTLSNILDVIRCHIPLAATKVIQTIYFKYFFN